MPFKYWTGSWIGMWSHIILFWQVLDLLVGDDTEFMNPLHTEGLQFSYVIGPPGGSMGLTRPHWLQAKTFWYRVFACVSSKSFLFQIETIKSLSGKQNKTNEKQTNKNYYQALITKDWEWLWLLAERRVTDENWDVMHD